MFGEARIGEILVLQRGFGEVRLYGGDRDLPCDCCNGGKAGKHGFIVQLRKMHFGLQRVRRRVETGLYRNLLHLQRLRVKGVPDFVSRLDIVIHDNQCPGRSIPFQVNPAGVQRA